MMDEYSPKSVSSAKPVSQPKVDMTPPPSFEVLISLQLSAGNWSESCRHTLAQFTKNNSLEDKKLAKMFPLIYGTNRMTLIALYIIEELFPHLSDESEMIVRKAKKYLTENGVSKPDNCIKHISLVLKK
jgi:hypothetical protein